MATFPTSIGDFTTVADDNYPGTNDAVAPLIDDLLRQIGAGVAELRDRTRETVNVKDPRYGALGDGSTNDRTAIQAAITAGSGKRIRIPAGTYVITDSAASLLSISGGCDIEGDGIDRTILRFVGTATYFNALNVIGAGVSLSNLTILLAPSAGNEAAAIRVAESNVSLRRVKIDGAVVYTTSLSHTAYGLLFASSGSVSNISADHCVFTRLNFPVLKSNTSTSTQDNIHITSSLFEGNFREDMSFNSPLGSMTNVRVSGCHFRNHGGIAAGQDSIYVAFASVSRFVVNGCTFEGSIREAIHVEEASRHGVISGNSIHCTFSANGAGVSILENDVAGTMVLPRNIVISGNTIRHAGTAKLSTTFGVWLINNASADNPGEAIIISDNIAQDMDVGFSGQTANGAAVLVRGNLAIGCASGFRWRPSSALCISGNTSRECDEGVSSVNGGAYVDHRFVDCTTAADAETAFPMTLVNPRFEFSEVAFTAGETKNFVLLPLAADTRLHGFGSVYVNSDTSPRYACRRDELTFGGSSLTVSNKMSIAPSSITTELQESGGNLRCQVFSSVVIASARITAWIDGHFVVAL